MALSDVIPGMVPGDRPRNAAVGVIYAVAAVVFVDEFLTRVLEALGLL